MTDVLVFPDKNIVIDAAEAVLNAWADIVAPAPEFTGRDEAVKALTRFGMTDLAAKVSGGTVDLANARMQASAARLHAELASDPAPGWLAGLMRQSADPRVVDLAASLRSGSVVLTTEVLAYVEYRLAAKGVPKGTAARLVLALSNGQHVVDVGMSQAAAVASGTLDGLFEQVQRLAPENLAAINVADKYWSAGKEAKESLPEKPVDVSWRAFKMKHSNVYGVDGEDLFLLWQVLECGRLLGRPVMLTTSDYHLAVAAFRAGVCPSVLYSNTAKGITSSVMSGRKVQSPVLAAAALAARTPSVQPDLSGPAVRPTPNSVRKPAGVHAAGPTRPGGPPDEGRSVQPLPIRAPSGLRTNGSRGR